MSYTVSDIKSELDGVLHGTTTNQVIGLDNLIDRSARRFLEDLDPMETIRIADISPYLYQNVWDYTCPSDLKGDRIVDIRPQVNRTPADQFSQIYNANFDANKQNIGLAAPPTVTVQWNSGVKSLRINKSLIAPLLVNAVNSITDNGTWAVGGDATNLMADSINFVYAGSSLKFDVSGAGTTAYLENSDMTAVDLSRDVDQGTEFLYAYIPSGSVVTNFILRWGSSATDYWTQTVTSAFNTTAFQTGWNLLAFDWPTATVVGAPDDTAVNYARLTLTYDGDAAFNYRFNSLASQLGSIYQIEYYSKCLFRDTAGVFQETITDDTNIVNLDTDSYNIFFSLVAYYCAQQVQGANSGFDYQFFLRDYEEGKKRYRNKIKNQVLKPKSLYYTMPNNARYVTSWNS